MKFIVSTVKRIIYTIHEYKNNFELWDRISIQDAAVNFTTLLLMVFDYCIMVRRFDFDTELWFLGIKETCS